MADSSGIVRFWSRSGRPACSSASTGWTAATPSTSATAPALA